MLNAASIHGYNAPARPFIQNMPHLGLMDTSAVDVWVTDSAAGMSAIVTGQKTRNGVISQLPPSGGKEGAAVKTILEYAEERGLSTGVITNMEIWDATPAACYAHAQAGPGLRGSGRNPGSDSGFGHQRFGIVGFLFRLRSQRFKVRIYPVIVKN